MANTVYKNSEGQIIDAHNNLFVFPDGTIHERHERFNPIRITSTVWNAMQRACAEYNRLRR